MEDFKKLQWFPGHMQKAMRMMREQLALCDGVIYVLDARCPAATFNQKLKDMCGAKPILYLLNKGDLADGNAAAILDYIKSCGASGIILNAVNARHKRALEEAINALIADKKAKNAERGVQKTFRFLVCGVPNTGKSTVINLFVGSKRAKTGDKAGVTRDKQWIRCDGFDLLDTPGTTPPSFDNQKLAMRLAFIGSLNDEILHFDDVALALLGELSAKYPARLLERYSISADISPNEMLDEVCSRRGFILRGGEPDYERAEKAVVDDFRKGRLGKITLDRAEDCKGLKF